MKCLKVSGMIAAAAVAAVLAGCCCPYKSDIVNSCQEEVRIPVKKTTAKVKLDGVIDAKEWKDATCVDYVIATTPNPLALKKMKVAAAGRYFEGGKTYIMYDDKNLYLASTMDDQDVMQWGKEDQGNLCTTGDLFEVFLKPDGSPSYWELWGSPNKLRTTFFYESCSYPFVSSSQQEMMKGFKIAVKVNGTLNNNKDKDKGWSIECVIPRSELAKTGVPFEPGKKWTILIARYNYNKDFGTYSRGPQFSTYPKIPQINYHLLPYYGVIDWK
ncbi:MAG: carbohydrate-binding family 9-like protein [Lentisphaeria bacterium]|nr:carbohydrate-binding family 9-like protein [Lentisphaeria bacterium]